jgi:putative spermidine/putrescine transport system substrate-binding protein
VKVVVVPGTSSDILAKVQASKDKPPVHVMFLDDGVMMRAIKMGLCQKLEHTAVLKDLYPSARMAGDMAAGVNVGMTGIAYNKKMFDEKKWAAPTSWMDFADPKFKGKVVFQSLPASTFGLHGFLMFNRIQGGTDKNVDPGFSKWGSTIGPNVLEYIPSSGKLSEMVQNGEAAIFPLTPTGVATQKARGIPMEYAQPKEGSVLLMVAECVTAKNDNPVMAQKLAEFLLTPQAQAAALEFGNQIPSNVKTQPGTPAGPGHGGAVQGLYEDRGHTGLGRDQRHTPGMEHALEQDGGTLSLRERIATNRKLAGEAIATLERLVELPEAKARLAEVLTLRGRYVAAFERVDGDLTKGLRDEARERAQGEVVPLLEQLITAVKSLDQLMQQLTQARASEVRASVDSAVYWLAGIGAAALVLGVVMAGVLARSVRSPGQPDLSQRTEEQASALQQTAASMEQLGGHRQAERRQRAPGQPAGRGPAGGQPGGEVVGRWCTP